MDFWQRIDALLDEHEIVIDLPRGSRHPRFPKIVIPLDYGYLNGTSSGDGREIRCPEGFFKRNTHEKHMSFLEIQKEGDFSSPFRPV